MDLGTIVGIVVACLLLAGSILVGGGSLSSFADVPSVFIVIGGAFCATLISIPLASVLKLHQVILKSVFVKPMDPGIVIRDLVRYAEVARREGILALEGLTGEMKDPFLIRGVKMAVDGTDPELIKTIMETDLEAQMDRHARGKQIVDTLGRYAPAFGMIGTLMGLIVMLQNMDDPSKIGPGMALALITTLYGAMLANIVCLPISDKLAARDAEEVLIRTIIITGVMAIQSGDNPRVVESKLMTFLPPSVRPDADREAA